MGFAWNHFKNLIIGTINLKSDAASNDEIKERIVSGGEINGTNISLLILAMFIASIGLNMNSTAVVIGAMLISPLMGAILSIAYGAVTYDAELIEKSFMSLLYEIIFCVLTSSLYFALSPMKTVSSELLARTSPTLWDALIAIFGGMAGIIGITRKEKSNVIPGVAIATALMPPLCTAGYGISRGNWQFFSGAMYLFFINSIFICFTSAIVLMIINTPHKNYANVSLGKKTRTFIITIIAIILIPSAITTYQMIENEYVNNRYNAFISNEFTQFENVQLISSSIDTKDKIVNVSLLGTVLNSDQLDQLSNDLSKTYGLSGYSINAKQIDANGSMSNDDIKTLIQTEINAEETTTNQDVIDSLQARIDLYQTSYQEKILNEFELSEINEEIAAIYPKVSYFEGNVIGKIDADGNFIYDDYVGVVHVKEELTDEELSNMSHWLSVKLSDYTVILHEVIEES